MQLIHRWEVRYPKTPLRRAQAQLIFDVEENDPTWAKAEGAGIRRVEGAREERRDVDGR